MIAPPAADPPDGVGWTLYDDLGNDLYTTTGVNQAGGPAPYAQTTYQLFNGNSVTLPGTSTAINCANPAPSAALPCATIDASGLVTQLKYDSAGDLASVSVPDGNGAEQATTTYSFDNDGEETSTTSPDGNLPGSTAPTTANYTTITAYNADGQTTSDTLGASGSTVTPRTTSYGYDGDGNQTTETDARGQTTTTAYDLDGLATLVTDPDGNSSLTCYDGDGNAAQTVPAAGVAANHLSPASCPASYPAAYNPAVTSNWLAGDATLATFNAAGEQIASYTPLPASQSGPPSYETTSYAYDGNANLIKTISPPDSQRRTRPGRDGHLHTTRAS